jgi:hypothetical protein
MHSRPAVDPAGFDGTLLRRDILAKRVASMQIWSDVQLVPEVEAED